MIKTIHVHIGGHKTGSTFIQESLGKIRDVLLVKGFLYPRFVIDGTMVNNHSVPFYSIFCKNPELYRPNVLRGYDTLDKIRQLNKNHEKKLSQQLENFDGDTLIISGEDISTLDREGIQNLKEYLLRITNGDAAIKIIFFCRHPITYARSHIQEVVKGGQILEQEMENYASFARSYYQTRLGNFLSVFPHDDISVIKYEDAISHTNGLLGAFLSVVGMDSSLGEDLKNKRANGSLSYESISLINAINRNVPRFVNHAPNSEWSACGHRLIRQISGAKFHLDRECNQRIWSECHDDMAWLYKNFSLSPYEFSDEDASENQRWDTDILEQIHDLLPRVPLFARDIFLSEIREQKMRHEHCFSQCKISQVEKFTSFHARINPSKNRIANLLCHYKIFGSKRTYKYYGRKFLREFSRLFRRVDKRF
jgi:hypothetical protein